jgi:hypothetical protein
MMYFGRIGNGPAFFLLLIIHNPVCTVEYVVIYFISNSFLAMPIEERFRIVLANSIGSRILCSLMQLLLSQFTRCRIREEANTASPPLKDSTGTTDVSI